MRNIAVFIDRDGTINEEVGYLDHHDKLHILPGVADAIRKLNQAEIPAFIVTNQSGVGRGYFSRSFLDNLHERLSGQLGQHGCRIDGIYVCPHLPDYACACRKPRPGMLLAAAREHAICLHKSYVIGDKMIDIRLGRSVCAKSILVMTGYGAEELRANIGPDVRPDHIAANLSDAVTWILNDIRSAGVHPPQLAGHKGRRRPRRILIVKPSSFGDIIHSLPVLWNIRRTFPDSYIGWVVKEVWKDLLDRNPLIDDVIILGEGISGFFSALRSIREMEFDTVIDLQGLLRSSTLGMFSGAESRIGFSNAREGAPIFYNSKINVPSHPMHAVDRYLLSMDVIASEAKQSANDNKLQPCFPLYINIEDDAWSMEFMLSHGLSSTRPVIAINPSARWIKKRWPASSYAALINQLIHDLKAGIIILGSKGDLPVSGEISALVSGPHAVATGKMTIKTLTALLSRVNLLVTNDSGPMHLAAALGIPVVAMFGPTDPRLTGPYGDIHQVLRSEMDCSPCFRKRCGHGRPLCMESITVDDVMAAVKNCL